jgi:aminoglycoside phosphotransferase (APT) family kinase protein
MERRHGQVIRREWPSALPDTDDYRRALAGSAVDTLADLHLVDYEALGLADLGRPDGFAARQVAGWSDRWRRSEDEPVPAMEELSAQLAGSIPVPQRAVLLHNDFKLDNLMTVPSGEVVALLDWDMATLGDPLVDLGTALAYWAGPDDAVYPLFGSRGYTLARVMAKTEVAGRYSERTGFDLSDLAFYEALALFRIAVIIQQIYIRWKRGQTADERFGMLGALVPPIADAALEMIG